MATKLNQVVAVVSGQKGEAEKLLTECYHALQKGDLFAGLSRDYTPRNADDADTRPPERKNPQMSVGYLYKSVAAVLAKCWDSVATQDWGNCDARANVVVDGATLLDSVPVTHLLFLEHKLKDMQTLIEKMPVRDRAESWEYSRDADMYVSPVVRKDSTKKVNKAIVLYQATDKHPAQTQLIQEDQVVGYWNERKFSTAISAQDKATMLAKVTKLAEAVKSAREEANSVAVERKEVAGKVLNFVFGDTLGV
jgi:hypothetical protein